MTLINIGDMATYGLAKDWANKVFEGNANFDQTLHCRRKLSIFGNYRELPDEPIMQPVTYSRNSTLSLGNDFTLTWYDIVGNNLQDQTKGQAFNYILKYNTEAYPFTLRFPVMPPSGKGTACSGPNAKWRERTIDPVIVERFGVPEYNDAPLNVYFDKSNLNLDNITYMPRVVTDGQDLSDGLLPQDFDISAPQITNQIVRADASPGSSVVFQFLPGDESSQALEYGGSNTASYTTTNGTLSSSSSTNTSSFEISRSKTASVGFDLGSGVSAGASVTQSMTSGWSDALTSLKEVNFTKSSGRQQTTEQTTTTTIKPGNIKKNPETGDYNYTLPTRQPDGSLLPPSINPPFVPGNWYKASIKKTITSIQNNYSGIYDIGGSLGTLADSNQSGASSSLSTAKALRLAKQNNYGSWDNLSLAQFDDSLNPFTIGFTGSAAGSGTLENNWIITFTNVADPNFSQLGVTGRFPLSRSLSNRKNNHRNHTDLMDVVNSKPNGMGVSHVFHKKSRGKKSVSGTGFTDIVHASKKGNHHFSAFQESFLHGNSKSDVFILGRSDHGNNIFSFDGNDTVKASSSQNVDLGKGDDTFHIASNSRKNSFHQILTGSGKDTVIINDTSSRFQIGDFSPYIDSIQFGDKINSNLLTAQLEPFEKGKKILDNSKIKFFYDGSHLGTAYLSNDSEFIANFVNPQTHQDIFILNAKNYGDTPLKRKHTAFQMFSRAVENGIAYSTPITPETWKAMDNHERAEIMHELTSLHGINISKEEHILSLENLKNSDYLQFLPTLFDVHA